MISNALSSEEGCVFLMVISYEFRTRQYRYDEMKHPTVVPPYKVNDPSKVLAIGLTETYSHMAPWHVIMGQSFGASITYQLDAGTFMKL